MAIILRYLYNTILYLYLPIILIKLYWKGGKFPEYRQRIKERFVFYSNPNLGKTIWVHAVSLGETIASIPLVKQLQQQYPDIKIAFTTTTPTGSDKAQKAFGDSLFHIYAPYDYPLAMKHFIDYIKPKIIIIMETEIWPNLLYYADKNGIPVLIANARISKKSSKGYKLLFKLWSNLLNKIEVIAAQSEADAQRYISVGAKKKQVTATGNIKFDMMPPDDLITGTKNLRTRWGKSRPIWIAASTHDGEEDIILDAFKTIKKQVNNALLVLVPRHPERFATVTNLCKTKGFTISLHSKHEPCDINTNIVIGDTIGELIYLYAASDVAFVGGSLSNIGGHNLLEPAAVNTAVISGPNLDNFRQISQLLIAENAVIIVNNAAELSTAVIKLITDKRLRLQQIANGIMVVNKNRGALQKLIAIIQQIMVKPSRIQSKATRALNSAA